MASEAAICTRMGLAAMCEWVRSVKRGFTRNEGLRRERVPRGLCKEERARMRTKRKIWSRQASILTNPLGRVTRANSMFFCFLTLVFLSLNYLSVTLTTLTKWHVFSFAISSSEITYRDLPRDTNFLPKDFYFIRGFIHNCISLGLHFKITIKAKNIYNRKSFNIGCHIRSFILYGHGQEVAASAIISFVNNAWHPKEKFDPIRISLFQDKTIVYFNTRGKRGVLPHWCEGRSMNPRRSCFRLRRASGSCCIFGKAVSQAALLSLVSNFSFKNALQNFSRRLLLQ